MDPPCRSGPGSACLRSSSTVSLGGQDPARESRGQPYNRWQDAADSAAIAGCQRPPTFPALGSLGGAHRVAFFVCFSPLAHADRALKKNSTGTHVSVDVDLRALAKRQDACLQAMRPPDVLQPHRRPSLVGFLCLRTALPPLRLLSHPMIVPRVARCWSGRRTAIASD